MAACGGNQYSSGYAVASSPARAFRTAFGVFMTQGQVECDKEQCTAGESCEFSVSTAEYQALEVEEKQVGNEFGVKVSGNGHCSCKE